MSYKFDFEFVLSHDSVSNLIKNIKTYRYELENSKKYILQALAEYTLHQVQIHIQDSVNSSISTGDLLESIKISPIFNDVISVYTDLAYAKYVEFGTGVTGSNNPHPKSDEAGWSYGEKGWVYKSSDGNFYYTEGEIAHQFMYRATQDLKANYMKIVKKVLRERGIIN